MISRKKIIILTIIMIAVTAISIIILDVAANGFVFFESFLNALKHILGSSNYIPLYLLTMFMVICVYSVIPLLLLTILILKKDVNEPIKKEHKPLLIIDSILSVFIIAPVCFAILTVIELAIGR